MLLQDKLRMDIFTKNEKVVIDYLLKQQENIESMTTASIAKETFTSKSTLVRIAKKLNFSGWSTLKKELLNEIEYVNQSIVSIDANIPFTKKDSLRSIAYKIATLEKETIQETYDLMSHDQLREATTILDRANQIHLFAVSNNLLLAQRFKHYMSRIHKTVFIHSLQSEIFFEASMARSDSCAIIISYTGETKELLEVNNLLKKQNIPVILLTSIGENSLTKSNNIIFKIATKEKMYSKIASYSTDISIEYILDTLYSTYFHLHYDQNLSFKTSISKAIEKNHFSENSIVKE